jgi:hypothetical protein
MPDIINDMMSFCCSFSPHPFGTTLLPLDLRFNIQIQPNPKFSPFRLSHSCRNAHRFCVMWKRVLWPKRGACITNPDSRGTCQRRTPVSELLKMIPQTGYSLKIVLLSQSLKPTSFGLLAQSPKRVHVNERENEKDVNERDQHITVTYPCLGQLKSMKKMKKSFVWVSMFVRRPLPS